MTLPSDSTSPYKLEEINELTLKIVKMNGPAGPFEIAFARVYPENNKLYFYRDDDLTPESGTD